MNINYNTNTYLQYKFKDLFLILKKLYAFLLVVCGPMHGLCKFLQNSEMGFLQKVFHVTKSFVTCVKCLLLSYLVRLSAIQ